MVLGILSVIYAICLVFGHDIMLNYEDGVQYTSLSVWMRVVLWIAILFFALNIARIAVTRIWRGGGWNHGYPHAALLFLTESSIG